MNDDYAIHIDPNPGLHEYLQRGIHEWLAAWGIHLSPYNMAKTVTIDTDNARQVSAAAWMLDRFGYEYHRSGAGETVFIVEEGS